MVLHHQSSRLTHTQTLPCNAYPHTVTQHCVATSIHDMTTHAAVHDVTLVPHMTCHKLYIHTYLLFATVTRAG